MKQSMNSVPRKTVRQERLDELVRPAATRLEQSFPQLVDPRREGAERAGRELAQRTIRQIEEDLSVAKSAAPKR
jgi:hypothetical protein